MVSSTRKKISARDRARAARARADAARVQRDQQVEATAAAFFAASDERDQVLSEIAELTRKVGTIEAVMGARVVDLGELGEKASYQRELFDIDETERKRLRALAEASNANSARVSPVDDQPTGVGEPVVDPGPSEPLASSQAVPLA